MGNVRHKMAIARELISRFDKAQEDRLLSPHESWFHKQLKLTYLDLASMERTIARQRARVANLQDGDANTSYFHRLCSYRRQKNKIYSTAAGDHVYSETEDMAAAAYTHYDVLLGPNVDREHTLDMSLLIESHDLSDLDAPFTEEEIWNAVKRLPVLLEHGETGLH